MMTAIFITQFRILACQKENKICLLLQLLVIGMFDLFCSLLLYMPSSIYRNIYEFGRFYISRQFFFVVFFRSVSSHSIRAIAYCV